MVMRGVNSRIDRSLRLLQVDADAPATSLAEALWLANILPPTEAERIEEPERKPPEPRDPGGGTKPVDPGGESKDYSTTSYPNPEAKSRIYAPQREKTDGAFIPATFITVPAADALPNRLAIERALKPFLKRFPSRRLKQLNGDKTAEASADRRAVTPVFEPLPERWFDVLLLVERSDAMEVWTDTVRELQSMLSRHGAFRNVRVLRFSVGDSVSLFTTTGQPLSARTAVDPDGRRLCLFLTNGTSIEWRRKTLIQFVGALGTRSVAAIIQLLPQHVWAHTALGNAREYVHSLHPGSPNAALQVADPISGLAGRAKDASCVPALTLEPASIARWAGFVMSPRRIISPAIQLSARSDGSEDRKAKTPSEKLSAFRGIASPGAFQLLRVLAGAPLTLPIMRLVQQSVSSSKEQFHLAEVMLSGLIERVTVADALIPADQVFYDFIPEVRELLLGTLSSQETETLDDTLKPVQERIRTFVESRTKTAIRDFVALLSDPLGLEQLPASARSFVEVSRRIYEGRGILSPIAEPASRKLLEIEQGSLISDTQVSLAVISGKGRYIASLSGTERRWIQIWERKTGKPSRDLALPPGNIQLLAAGDTDDLFAVSEGALIPLTTKKSLYERLPLPFEDGVVGLRADGGIGVIAQFNSIQEWDLRTGERRRTYSSSTKGRGQPTCVAVGEGAIVVGFTDGAISMVSTDEILFAPEPVKAISISRTGSDALVLLETGSVMRLSTKPPELTHFPAAGIVSIAMSGDGGFAAMGGGDGSLEIWDVGRGMRITTLRHGKMPVWSVSLSASGSYAVSTSDGGLKSWDLKTFIRAMRPLVERKARTPRYVRLVGRASAEDTFKEKVKRALEKAGHYVSEEATLDHDYTVAASENLANLAWFPEALSISNMSQLPRLLEELDREPPGPLFNLPPTLQTTIARPEIEKQLTRFIIGLKSGSQAIIQGDNISGVTVSLMKVLASDRVRRTFARGICWDASWRPNLRKGGALFIRIEIPVLPPLPENCVILHLIRGEEQPPIGPVFKFPPLNSEESANHLRGAGMSEEQIDAAQKFHHNNPLLVSFAAGAFRHGIQIEKYTETTEGLFLQSCRIALAKLDQSTRTDLIRFSAYLPDDLPSAIAPAPKESIVQLVSDFGLLMVDGRNLSLLSEARDTIAQLFPEEVAAAHEFICSQLESRAEPLRGEGIKAIDHARLAGGARRVEAYLRHRVILADCIIFSRLELVEKLGPLAEDNDFIKQLCEKLPDDSWANAPMSHIDGLLSPTKQWPRNSGVFDAHAQRYRGESIRILVPGNGCNPAHPEFLGRSLPSNHSLDNMVRRPVDAVREGYSTALCSVIAGSHIGVAPAALLEPLMVLESDLTTSTKTLSYALSSYLQNPPDILCLTMGFRVTGIFNSDLHSIIQQLVEREVLVVVAAGNDGPNQFSDPGTYPEVLSVGFCDFEGRIAEQSTRGTYEAVTPPRTVPDVYGYGVNVTSAEGDSGYSSGSGSAYACAYVAGIAALFAQAMGIRGAALRELLINTAEPPTRIARFALMTDVT
jgi:WD40 repeat protein